MLFCAPIQMHMNFLGIIPARYGSTRLEGKPLVDINGKPMIQWVYEKVRSVMEHVFVATDDIRIVEAVEDFGGDAVMTSIDHETGTNRCLEAAEIITKKTNVDFDVIINIQGDEPMMNPEQIETLQECFQDSSTQLATLVIPVSDPVDIENESEVFVTFDKDMNALYFSRAVIPVVYGVEKKNWMKYNLYYKHLGLYAYTFESLREFASLKTSNLEQMEKLEQNRWLENGGKIKVGITEHQSIPVDTLEDLKRIREII